jgi:CBS domain-containing protein
MNVHATVSEIMQREPLTLRPDDHLDVAEGAMSRGRLRHIPITADGHVVGVMSNRDLNAAGLTRALNFEPMHREAFLRSIRVRQVMKDPVITARPDTTLREAASVLVNRRIGCLPIVNEKEELVGLVTETDLLKAMLVDDAPEAVDEAERSETSRLDDFVEGEIEHLERLRDELQVQVHLGKAEAKDFWDELDHRWGETVSRVRRLVRHPVREGPEVARALVDDLKHDYRRLEKLLD